MKILLLFLLTVSIYAKDIVNKIAFTVNGIPFTKYDIKKTEKQLHINKDQAIGYLIDKAVFQSLLKKYSIYVDNFDIEKALHQIAVKNNTTSYKFKEYLAKEGKLKIFLKELKLKIQKDKLIKHLNIDISKNEILKYYNQHKKDFTVPSKIDVTEYLSKNKNSLLEIKKNPLANLQDVKSKNLTLETNETNPCFIDFIKDFPNKSFTTIFKSDSNTYKLYYIINKGEPRVEPLNRVIDKIYQKLFIKKANETLKELLEKEKSIANIKFRK